MSVTSFVQHTNHQPWGDLEKTVRLKVLDFLDKLAKNHEAPGLHIEPMQQPKDRRARTGRVDKALRAVLFRLDADRQPVYVYLGTYEHDAAISLARRTRLEYHAPTGAAQFFVDPEPIQKPQQAAVPEVTSTPKTPAQPHTPTVRQPRSNPVAAHQVVVLEAADRLGLDDALVKAAIAAPDEDALLEVLDGAPPWQADALMDLGLGYTIDHVAEKFSLDVTVEVPAGASEDERLLRGFEHPAARMQFAILDDQPEEFRRAVESGDFDAWKVFLHPQQRKLVEGRWGGAFRVSGGAGTGKTVVLVHRAVSLATENPDARVVATTFNKALAESLSDSIASLAPDVARAERLGSTGIHVAGPDSMAASAVLAAGRDAELEGMEAIFGTPGRFSFDVESEAQARSAWDSASRAAVAAGLEGEASSPAFLRDEYLAVILPQRITSQDAYLRVGRKGRGVALNRAQRAALWQGISAYRSEGRANQTLSWAERLHVAAAILDAHARATGQRFADHVLVDEGQDLHEGHWKFLRALVAEGPDDLFIAEDSQQRIYGRSVVLGRLGIKIVGRSRRLNLNYRTTKENLDFALRALRGLDITNVDGEPLEEEHATSARSGPLPLVIEAENDAAEYAAIGDALQAWLAEGEGEATPRRLGDAAILAYSAAEVQRVVRALETRGMKARTNDQSADPDAVSVLTMHRAKGMEFRFVGLPGLGESGQLGKLRAGASAAERSAESVTRRSLVYVAATRARDVLVVTHTGKLSTILL